MTTPTTPTPEQDQRPEIPLTEREGHIIWGEPFTIDASLIEGAEEVDGPITIYPEVVNLYDEQGRILTLKLAHRLDKPIRDHETGELTDTILLGSFGQNDPIRMWFASIYTGEILSPKFLEAEIEGIKGRRGQEAKLRLDETLYVPFNAAYIANPDSDYQPEDNIHNTIRWPEALPDEILNEISRRIENNEPLNYQYLGHLISNEQVGGLENQPWKNTAIERMNEERDASRRIRDAFMREKERKNILDEHYEAMDKLIKTDMIIDERGIYIEVLEFDGPAMINYRARFTSEIPEVNLSNELINEMIRTTEFRTHFDSPDFPFVADHIREVMTRRLYDNSNLRGRMTLGQFASSVYQLRFNNTDPNLGQLI